MTLIAKRFTLVAILLPLVGGVGCRNVWKGAASAPVAQTTPESTRIVYRTRTDRLNIAGGKLPPCSIATLLIESPHPEMKIDAARVTVVIERCTADASPFPSRGLSGAISSLMKDDSSAASASPVATYSADLPLWQVQTIVSSLEKANFFDRQLTVLSPDVFLSLEVGPRGVGKKYCPVDELDVLLMRVADESTSSPVVSASASSGAERPARGELARLPAISVFQ